MRYRLTDSTVRTLSAPESGSKRNYHIFYDNMVDGFGLRVTKSGARSFILNYRTRADRRERRYTIGDIDTWAATKARDETRRLKRDIDTGRDPLEEIEERRKAPTMAALADRYVEQHLPRKRKRSRIEDERLLSIIIDKLGRKKVADVSYADVDKLHQDITKERGPFRANRVLALLSKMFTLSIKWKMRADNPAKGVEKNAEPMRKRYLDENELSRLIAALDAERDQQAADIIRLLLLTGARSAEVLNATWDQFKLDAGLWIKPHTATKQNEEHRLPLSNETIDLLVRRKGETPAKAKYVFPGDSPFKPRASIRHAWDRLRKATGLDDVRIHDLRHSHASLLVNAGYSLPVIGAMLGHKTPGTTARYAHLADDTLHKAAKSVGAKIIPVRKGA